MRKRATAAVRAFDPTLAAIGEVEWGDQIALGSFDLSPTMLEAIDQGKAPCRTPLQR